MPTHLITSCVCILYAFCKFTVCESEVLKLSTVDSLYLNIVNFCINVINQFISRRENHIMSCDKNDHAGVSLARFTLC